jgi:DNA (cytosine-5)-methyltransferase 1
MRELHLFAGSGGGILGGMLLGHTTVAAVEIEPYCQDVLRARQRDGILPEFQIFGDIREFDGRPWQGKVDVVAGGFPCQDISVAGKGAGINGDRSGLWSEMARVISEVMPRFVFVENSPMLVSRGLSRVLCDLAKIGYWPPRWKTLGGHDTGSCTDGKRIWILATKANSAKLESLDIPQTIKSCPKKSRGRQFARAIRAMLRPDDFTRIKRNPDEVARGMDRLKAIGNGQDPVLAATAFRILSEGLI